MKLQKSGLKCLHCGENNPELIKMVYDGLIRCETCGWTADRAGMHPPSMEELEKRLDWQKRHALICYANNMYDFIKDIREFSGNANAIRPFVYGWLKGFQGKINREAGELQRCLAQLRGMAEGHGPETKQIGRDESMNKLPESVQFGTRATRRRDRLNNAALIAGSITLFAMSYIALCLIFA
jgi:hypothetical protein